MKLDFVLKLDWMLLTPLGIMGFCFTETSQKDNLTQLIFCFSHSWILFFHLKKKAPNFALLC